MGIVLLSFLVLAQHEPPIDGPIYEIPINGQEHPVYGWMEPITGGWEITEDKPWEGYPKTKYAASKVNDADRIVEVASKREARLRREAERDGLKEVVPGTWVALTEAELAEHAQAAIAEVRQHYVPREQPAEAKNPTTTAPASKASAHPGFISMWGFHIAIVLVSGTLIALVVRFAILA